MLIGFMATGKSTVGRIVAARTGRDFVDLDSYITELSGKSVGDIFRDEGEAGFRRRESEALTRALGRENLVLATGGGAACREDNLAAMLARGFVVALAAPPSEVIKRTGGASGRPLLDGTPDPLGAAADLLARRDPFYARAHHKVDTVGKTAEEVAEDVMVAMHHHDISMNVESDKQEI